MPVGLEHMNAVLCFVDAKDTDRDEVDVEPRGIGAQPGRSVCRRKMTAPGAVDIRNQELVFVLVLNRAAVSHTLASGERRHAGDITQDRARLPAQSGLL